MGRKRGNGGRIFDSLGEERGGRGTFYLRSLLSYLVRRGGGLRWGFLVWNSFCGGGKGMRGER